MGHLVYNQNPGEADRDLEIALRYATAAGEKWPGDNAIALLSRVAEYLKQGQPVPSTLAGIVVEAFENAATAKPNEREKVLAHGLGLARGHRPPKHHRALIDGTVVQFIRQGCSETKAVKAAAEKLNVSPTTVRNSWRKFRDSTRKELGFLPWADHRKDDDPVE